MKIRGVRKTQHYIFLVSVLFAGLKHLNLLKKQNFAFRLVTLFTFVAFVYCLKTSQNKLAHFYTIHTRQTSLIISSCVFLIRRI